MLENVDGLDYFNTGVFAQKDSFELFLWSGDIYLGYALCSVERRDDPRDDRYAADF